MKPERWIQRGLGCLLCVLLCNLTGSAFARPRPPGPPYPEIHLGSWQFNDTNQLALAGSGGFTDNIALVESFSGNALSMEGGSRRLFAIPAVGDNGRTNLATSAGTIRFWFRPSWSSTTVNGNGPGLAGTLFEVGAWGQSTAASWWSLRFGPTGDAISFVAQSGGASEEFLNAPIQWQAGDWHQIALSYSSQGCWLFLDGQLAAQGLAVALVPLDNTAGVLGFTLGSDVRGSNLAQGQFDELTTFASVQRADLVAWNFTCLAGVAALGPITPEEDAFRSARMAAAKSSRTLSSSDMMYALSGPPAITNGNGNGSAISTNLPPAYSAEGLKLTVPTMNGSNATITIFDGTDGVIYDLFRCTNFLGNFMTNSTWIWLGQVTNNQTFTLTNQPWPNSFYILGIPQDTDSDGLTDAYELLVSKTNPTVFSSPDTDSDGMPDLWEIRHGLNPSFNDANLDPDGDGLTNLQEFLGGGDPLSASTFEIQILQPKTNSNLP